MPVQAICKDCKFVTIHQGRPVCTLFRAYLTGEPIQCQGKIEEKD